jgi:SagB-type dehydrogenase family enzyme
VPPGLYHYEVADHALALLAGGDPTERLYETCCYQEGARTASVVVLIAASLQRTKHRYGERGYRYVLLDVGHLAQNLLLACSALGLGAMTTCGFFDDAANGLLRLDGVDEAVLYVAFLGRPGHGPSTGMEVL